jgi:hypothetical protein
MSIWEDQEARGPAHLWRRAGENGAFRYVVTDDHSNALPDLGPNPGYADAKTAWAAYEERRGIAREIDLNEM